MLRSAKNILPGLFVVGLSMILLFFIIPAPTHAVTGSDWDPGNIIDDSVFYNNSDLSTSDIQNFLNSKVTCDTWGTKPSEYGGGTRAQYGASRGYPAPYTCLKDYSQNGKSSAQIIKEAADTYQINPKVIIVLLQKEQSLVTDEWPWSSQYRSATGYGCPDTAPCDAEYYGFTNQVTKAAYQFRRYATYPSQYRYKPYQSNYIQYNPNAGCGGSNVSITNLATAGLYNYTPYQPNASSLNNLYGSGDSCGAYGNRNFWRLFSDWFGTTRSSKPYTNLKWNYENLDGSSVGVNPLTNTTGVDPSTIVFNNELYVFSKDTTAGDLRLSVASESGWQLQVLDGQGGINGRTTDNVGNMSSAAILNNTLHVFYYNQSRGSIRHGWLDAGSGTWSFEALDGQEDTPGQLSDDIGYGSTTTVFGTSLQLFYYNRTQGNLRHAWYTNEAGWKFENLDGDPGSIARNNANTGQSPVTISYGNGIQLFYYDADQGNLRHAWYTTEAGWKFENLDGDPGSIGRFNSNVGAYSSVSVLSGHLQLFYYDIAQGNLRHAWTTEAGWKFENLDGDPGSIGRFNSNVGQDPDTVILDNVVYVFYRDVDSGMLRSSWADSTGWHFATLEGGQSSDSGTTNNTGFTPSSAAYQNSLQVFYFDNTFRALRHAFGVDR